MGVNLAYMKNGRRRCALTTLPDYDDESSAVKDAEETISRVEGIDLSQEDDWDER